ncbi:hypothetical protein [Streptomyces nanshensis]|uniref:Integral membrane protein n=1 Tax=Streptomyces nanshensis TaxID=518642 RepID=A0A1E7L2Z8_9ACTN|nr:hypothetical protein [Streptomyces nanshensis]OEV10559.1 hypothetical protein AN218_17030 [Streptomyces nanshensis]
MTASPDEITEGQLLLAELQHLKSEQTARIGSRDHLMYATLAAMAGVLAAVFNSGQHPERLLLLPPVAIVLGWTYLMNDQKVSAIGRYIRCELAPRLDGVVTRGSTPRHAASLLDWETTHRGDRRRISRKWLQLSADLLLFAIAPLAALTVYWATGPLNVWLLVASVGEVLTVLVLSVQIVVYADLRISWLRGAQGPGTARTGP